VRISQSTEDQIMSLAAFRYCLGRKTYIVGICIGWIKKHWKQFSNNTKSVMLRDIIEAYLGNLTGMKMDTISWIELLKWAWAEEDNDLRTKVKSMAQWNIDLCKDKEKKEVLESLWSQITL